MERTISSVCLRSVWWRGTQWSVLPRYCTGVRHGSQRERGPAWTELRPPLSHDGEMSQNPVRYRHDVMRQQNHAGSLLFKGW